MNEMKPVDFCNFDRVISFSFLDSEFFFFYCTRCGVKLNA